MTTATTINRPSAAPVSAPPPGSLPIMFRCLGYLRPYWRLTAGSYLALLATTGLALLVPQLVRATIDRGITGDNLRALHISVLTILGITLVKGVMSFALGRWTEVASQGVAYDLRNALYRKLSALSFSYHDRAQVGQLLSRAIQDVDRIRFMTGRALLRLAEGVLLLIGAAIFLTLMNPSLALLALWTMPIMAYWALRFGRRFRPLSLAVQQQLAVLTTGLEQNLRGARVVKAFAQEPAEIARFDDENDHWFDISVTAARLQALNMPFLDLIANLGTVFIIWYGGTLVVRGSLTLGELVAFSTYMGMLIQPVRRLGQILPALATAIAAGERVFDILDAQSEVKDAPDATPLPPVAGHVRFEHVSFSYFGRQTVLDDICLEARPGQVIALLGPTGSGKSSIINLIPRFYDPTAGRITIDGHDIRGVQLNSLRDQIGIVLQETTLFAASIRENLAFGRPGASDAEIVEAAKAAQAHEFIMAMPNGYDTPVGERGATLSGGQKQRVAIARALLKDPHVLILDDATSSVDSDTERLIQAALERLMQGRTSFVIAQRMSTVRMADLIVVLDGGRIAATGTHSELLRTSELYTEIYHRQLRPQEEQA
jgi:ABC-type multidrug transport system fused ATPase/permease subunit